jgi:hypothetical protein
METIRTVPRSMAPWTMSPLFAGTEVSVEVIAITLPCAVVAPLSATSPSTRASPPLLTWAVNTAGTAVHGWPRPRQTWVQLC